MAMLTIRNLPDEVHRALRARSVRHGQSMEAEVRDILKSAVVLESRAKLGSLLANIGRKVKLDDEDILVFESLRDKQPARIVRFE